MKAIDIDSIMEFISTCSALEEIQSSEVTESMLSMLEKLKPLLEKKREKPQKNINLLDMLWADENANSRILGALFAQKNKGKYDILQSFIDTFLGDDFKHTIGAPEFYNEHNRIDLLVVDADYCIIFENKIHGAVLQKNQLARYINSMKAEGYTDDQIYVVFLPPTFEYEPTNCSWLIPNEYCNKCSGEENKHCEVLESYKELYECRYNSIPFKECILPWLKKSVLPECKICDTVLFSALTQYIDFLEGLYNLRNNNDNLDMEIKDKIKDILKFGDDELANHDIITSKLTEIKQVQNYLIEIEDELHENCFSKIETLLNAKYPDLITKQNPSPRWRSLMIKVPSRNHSVYVAVEENVQERSVYYGLVTPKGEEKEVLKDVYSDIISHYMNQGGFKRSATWIMYKYASFSDIFKCMSEMIDYILAHN